MGYRHTSRNRQNYGAYRLLTTLLYGHSPSLFTNRGKGQIEIHSMRSVARLLGTSTAQLHRWLDFLKQTSYLVAEPLFSGNKRSCLLQFARPRWEVNDE